MTKTSYLCSVFFALFLHQYENTLIDMNEILTVINSYLWGWPMIVLLVGTHIFLTMRLKFPQRYIGKAIKLSFQRDANSKGDVSQFAALATGLAATIGTGNIIGVATAVTMGGPGAVFWCWVTGVFGIATKYAEGLLSIKYRITTKEGTMLGGPMYAIERGMGCKWLAVLFALFAFLATFGIGCTIQSNAISTMASESFGWDTTWIGLALAILIGSVVIFGVKGIARVCELLVPFMAVFYVAGCIVLLIYHGQYIGEAISVILKSAFSAQAATGGFVGSTIMLSMRYGIARGLFSNEAGLGSAPIVAAAAKTKNPVRQALVSSTSVFWDTVIICALTGLVLVTTILADNGVDSSASATLTRQAFEQIPIAFAGYNVGGVLLSIAIFTFAFSTILGWSYYGEKALEYLCGKYGKVGRYIFRVLITIGTYFGATNALEAVWNFGDAANALMAIPNLICLLVLSGVLVKETRYYLWEDRLDEEAKDQNSTN